ncbi:MAG TPA: C4-type zinc ribbon domain-containing protein [Acidobacteriota bacterium]|nr:C4-type zinc ribbon domain-containing protein [Acidobacteriota bacterium]
MAVDLTPLIQLHFLDLQIASLNSRISGMPDQIQELDRKLDRFRRNLTEKKELIADNLKKRRELEGDLNLIETKRTRYKEQLDTVKTNKEYTALQHEIDGVTQAIRQIEDQILVLMEEAEQIKAALDEAQGALDREESVILKDKKVVEQQVEQLRVELQNLQAQRDEWIHQVPEEVMEVYNRVARGRKGVAMAEAKNQICMECHMRIRPQLFQEIKRNDSVITCESCSRILFFVPPPGAEKAEIESSPSEHSG